MTIDTTFLATILSTGILRSSGYWILYFILQSPIIALRVLGVRQVLAKHLDHYRGLDWLGRYMLLFVSIISIAIASIFVFRGYPHGPRTLLVASDNAINVGIFTFLLISTILLRLISVPTRRNVTRLEFIFLVYFGLQSVGHFLAQYEVGHDGNALAYIAGVIFPASGILCFTLIAVLLRRSGEILVSDIRTPEQIEETREMDEKLTSLARRLANSRRV